MELRSKILAASAALLLGAAAVPGVGMARGLWHGGGASSALTGEAARGQAVFTAQGCYLCHGRVGQGAQGIGATLVPLRLDDPGLIAFVRHPTGAMPPYDATLLSDADVVAIASYLRALPASRPAADIPLLASYVTGEHAETTHPSSGKAVAAGPATSTPGKSTAAGQPLYLHNCAGCHGQDRQGGVGPNLQAEGQKRDADAVARLIMAPPPGMPKLYPQPLSGAQVKAIAGYVVSR